MFSRPTTLTQSRLMLVQALLLFMAGALAASAQVLPAWFWGGGLGLILLVFLGLSMFMKPSVRWLPLCGMTVILTGGFVYQLRHFEPAPNDLLYQGEHSEARITGTLLEAGNRPGRWILQAQTMAGVPSVSGRTLVQLYHPTQKQLHIPIGSQVTVIGELIVPETARFPGDFDQRGYLRQKQVTTVLNAQNLQLVSKQPPTRWFWVLQQAEAIRNRVP